MMGAVPARVYTLPVQVRQNAATVVDALVWSARNTLAKVVQVRRIYLAAGFDGVAAMSVSQYKLIRFRTATPSGGAALAVQGLRANGAVTGQGITDARVLDTGLTVTSVTFDGPFAYVGAPRQLGVAVAFDYCFYADGDPLELVEGDGLGIRIGVTAVIGDSITGYVQFAEIN